MSKFGKETELAEVVKEGDAGKLKQILDEKFSDIDLDMELETKTGHYPMIHIAAQEGHSDIIRLLAEKGANINKLTSNYDYSDYVCTPLDLAVRNGEVDAVKVLLECGADGNIECYVYTKDEDDRMNEGSEDIIPDNKWTPLLSACDNMVVCKNNNSEKAIYEEIAILLLTENQNDENKVNVNYRGGNYSDTFAITLAADANSTPVVKTILENGGNVNVQETDRYFSDYRHPRRSESSALDWAVDNQNFEMLDLLFKYHADPSSGAFHMAKTE